VLAFSTQICGFKPGRSCRIFRAKKSSFGGEVKPSVPCRRFAACKRSLNLSGNRNLGKNYYRTSFSSTVPPFASRISRVVAGRRHLAAKVGTSKGGGKGMANYPQERVQDAVCQSHTGHMTVLWFLPSPAFKAEY